MPANQTQRPKFFEEQYLGAADLTAVVDYGRIQQARHALGAHTWGIAIGLTLKETPQAGGAVTVHLLPGYALGRLRPPDRRALALSDSRGEIQRDQVRSEQSIRTARAA